jgi:23S rRNA pseudouridine1911/1915/1917 synthase
LKKELILVDGVIGSTATFINGGERIELKQVVEKKITRQVKLDLKVLFEDDHLAIIQKPAGITVSGNRFFTVANALAQNVKKSTVFDAVNPKPVHRLDYPTTGALLVGKTSSAIIQLNTLFETKQIQKVYYAVTIGVMKKNGRVVVPIDSKESMSDYEVEQTIVSERFEYLNLVKLLPKTGRRHQLRKHLALIGNPILGDADYGKKGLVLKGKGLYLHAHSLQFMHPILKTNVYVQSELPKKFIKLFLTV